MAEEKKFNEERLDAIDGKSKEEVLDDKELASIYIDYLEYQISLLEQINEKNKMIIEQSEKNISLMEEEIDLMDQKIQMLDEEAKYYRKLLRKNGISVPFQY